MTIKLILLRSGEDIITDVKEMLVGEENNSRVVGYFLTQPHIVKIKNPNTSDGNKTSFDITLYPWMPLSKDKTILIPSDWAVTMTEPIDKLKEMYTEEVINYESNNQDSGIDEQSNFD